MEKEATQENINTEPPFQNVNDSERTLRYAVTLARASGAKLFVCHRPKSPAAHEEVLRTMQTLITAGETFPAGPAENVATDWESVLLDGADLGTAITREAELRRADHALTSPAVRGCIAWFNGSGFTSGAVSGAGDARR